jgi:hypothetical protein
MTTFIVDNIDLKHKKKRKKKKKDEKSQQFEVKFYAKMTKKSQILG